MHNVMPINLTPAASFEFRQDLTFGQFYSSPNCQSSRSPDLSNKR